jgi:hypothetical protein
MDSVFLTGAIVLVLALVISVFMKEVPLRTQSGLQAARAAEAAANPTTPDPAGATHDPEPVSGSLTG